MVGGDEMIVGKYDVKWENLVGIYIYKWRYGGVVIFGDIFVCYVYSFVFIVNDGDVVCFGSLVDFFCFYFGIEFESWFWVFVVGVIWNVLDIFEFVSLDR